MIARFVHEELSSTFKSKDHLAKASIVEKMYPDFVKIFNDLFPDNPNGYSIEIVAGIPKAQVTFKVDDNIYMLSSFKYIAHGTYSNPEVVLYYQQTREPGVHMFRQVSRVYTADEVMKYVNRFKKI